MATEGLYIHIPYCRKACAYCDFHFSTTLKTMPDMVDAMLHEAEVRLGQHERRTMATWYWGGGTPSLMPEPELRKLWNGMRRHFELSPDAEVTLEVNPEDVTPDTLALWRDLGVNRFSMGIQSFDNRDLQWMGRVHDADMARAAIQRAQDAGFDNITVDLIYGLPERNLDDWQAQVGQAMELGVPHLSTYALTVEPRTALHAHIAKGQRPAPRAARAAEDFLWYRQYLREIDWTAYEISNASRPGWEAVHNQNYWKGHAYTGLGPGAHSFDGQRTRRWNVANNPGYIRAIQKDEPCYEQEQLSTVDQLNERIMTSLRMKEGLSRDAVEQFKPGYAAELDALWAPAIAEGKMQAHDQGWALTDQGLLFADALASDGFWLS